ncbi:beta-ketoacyl synthase N-terminal-like domain-containing protein [Sporichthya brevicatena]
MRQSTTDSTGGTAVAIVGMAAVLPGAPDLATYRENLRAGVDAITDVPASRWDPEFYDPGAAKTRPGDRMYCRRGGFVGEVTIDPMRFGIMPMAVGDIEAEQLVALATAAAAIDDAGGPDALGDRRKVGIVLGRGGYFNAGMARFVDRVRTANQLVATLRELMPGISDEQLESVRASFSARAGELREESGIDLMVPNLVASRTANRLDLAGPAYTVDAACASSLIAVDHAVRDLASGRCDVVLAGGVHHCHDITFWSGFNLLGALSPSERIRPFHRGADGILIGEGTAVVVLKRLADVRDDERVYAVIRGTGVAGDGRAASLMAPQSAGQVAAMNAAWAAAGVDPRTPGSVGLIEAHGTATVAGDATELASLTEVFGPSAGGPDIGIGSVKSMIGHAMPAAGAAGLIKAALAVSGGFLPPTLHCDDPHPALEGTRFAPVTALQEWEADGPRRAGVNAFGFGGINAHVVLEELRSSDSPAYLASSGGTSDVADATAEKVLLFTGADATAIAAQLDAADDVLLARDDTWAPPVGGPARLAIVNPDAKRLALARKVVAQGRPWRGRNDVWFSTSPLLGPGGGRVAFLFPGLEEVFSPRVDDVAAHFGLPPVRSAADAGLGRRGLELAGVGRLLDRALRAMDIRPDVVAGHSIGEWSALIAAGGAPFEEFADSTRAFDSGPGVPDLVFAVLGCGASVAVEAIAGLERVVLSHDNCPHQSIICGEQAQVDVALDRLRERGVAGSLLPFKSGFHTPYLEPYLGPTRDFIAGLTLRQVSVPLWSATTVAPYPAEEAEVRSMLLRNLVEPVLFGPLIQRLYAEGVRAFVQVGTGSLPGFVEDTLDNPATPHLVISANIPKRSGLEQLRRVAAALWAEGAAPRFSRLAAEQPAEDPAPTPAAPRRPGLAVPLALGAPLLRLGDDRPTLTPPTPPGAAPGGDVISSGIGPVGGDVISRSGAVADEFRAFVAEVNSAAADVLAAASPESAAQHRRPSPESAAQHPGTQNPGAGVHFRGEGGRGDRGPRSAVTERRMSLGSDPYLTDHALLQAPAEAPAGARYPIVPMTGTIALIVEAAAALVPERVVTGVRGVRALRPLAVEPEVALRITATEQPRENGGADLTVVSVVVDGSVGDGPVETYARATVLLADDYPAAPALRDAPLTRERAPATDGRGLYSERWMFHGPEFQGVRELTAIADDGVRGVVAELPAPGSLLDAAGQLLGYWVAIHPENSLVLPATIGSVSFFGPPPAVGATYATVVRVRSATDVEVVADLELRDGAGNLWCHVTGWTDRRLEGDPVTVEAFRRPATSTLAQEQPGGWFLLVEPWTDPVARDLARRQYLAPAEENELAGRTPRAARHWLLGRIAAKDAVRAHRWAAGHGPIYPAEVGIGNDSLGAPYATGPGEGVSLSLAHSGPFAAALAGSGPGGVGIDLELVADAPAEAALLTESERELLETVAPAGGDPAVRAAWVTRFWTAKEAVAKAAGTGLGGRPARFVVTRVENDRLLVVVDGNGRWVSTRSGELPVPYAVGWTRESDILGTNLGS